MLEKMELLIYCKIKVYYNRLSFQNGYFREGLKNIDWALNTPLYWNISPRPSEMVSAIYFLREEATDNIDPFLDSYVK